MAKGGARQRSGPAADPNALVRARDGKEWTRLPAEGRPGPAPAWPSEIEAPSAKERALWTRLWKTPQALVWESDGVHDAVAMYVRIYLEAADPGGLSTTRQLAKTMAADLLLSIPAMISHRYVIVGTAADAAIQEAVGQGRGNSRVPRHPSARERFTVVPEPTQPIQQGAAPAVETSDDAPPF